MYQEFLQSNENTPEPFNLDKEIIALFPQVDELLETKGYRKIAASEIFEGEILELANQAFGGQFWEHNGNFIGVTGMTKDQLSSDDLILRRTVALKKVGEAFSNKNMRISMVGKYNAGINLFRLIGNSILDEVSTMSEHYENTYVLTESYVINFFIDIILKGIEELKILKLVSGTLNSNGRIYPIHSLAELGYIAS